MSKDAALKKLSDLETRVTQTAEGMARLKGEYARLAAVKTELEQAINDLKSNNRTLSDEIQELKSSNSFDKEEVRKRIDRMLEKFGELQL